MPKIILTIALIMIILFPTVIFAQTGLGASASNLSKAAKAAGADTSSSFGDIVGTIINAALTLVGLIFMILMVYAGYLWMTARGEEQSIEKAKKIITAAIIGLVIVVSAYAITVFVTNRFQGKEQTSETTPESTPSKNLFECAPCCEKHCNSEYNLPSEEEKKKNEKCNSDCQKGLYSGCQAKCKP